MTKLETLKTEFARVLEMTYDNSPGYYVWPREEMPKVIERMQTAFDKHRGVRGINIDSLSFRRLAKQFGIKNTYKSWDAWLAS